MRTKYLYPIIALMSAVTFLSCSTSKKVVKDNTAVPTVSTEFSAEDYVGTITKDYQSVKGLTAKVKVEVAFDGKDLSTSGTLKMTKDNIIQLTLIDPILGLMEVGRMEFTPTNVVVIDRLNKQYIDVPYSEVSFLKRANVDFNSLQSLFWNELFIPGRKKVDAGLYTYSHQPASEVRMDYQDRMLHYQFVSEKSSRHLTKTSINSPSDSKYAFSFSYGDFAPFQNRQFPKEMTMSFTSSGKAASLTLSLSSLKASSEKIASTTPSSKYTKVTADKVFKMLMK